MAPTQSRCGLRGVACVPTDRPSPKLSSFRIKNGPARVSPADVDVDPEAKPARATRSTQAALWRLLEPRLQLGLSHLPVSKASRAQDVLKTAAGGARSCPGGRRGGRGEAVRGIRGVEKAAAGPVVPAAPTPTIPSVHPAWRGAGGHQHAQHQLSLPRPPPSSPLSANPQGRHGPPALQMRKRQFRNWPTVPANTGDERKRRKAGSTGLPRGPRAGPGLS